MCVCSWWRQQHTDKLNTQVALHQLYQYASKYYDVVRKTFLSFSKHLFLQNANFWVPYFTLIMMQSLLFWII